MRIVYLSFPTGQVAGGQKIIARHVETLRDLGFNAVWWRPAEVALPWLEHSAPVEVGTPFQKGDIAVLPADAPNAIRDIASAASRVFVFCQGHITFASTGAMEACREIRDPVFMAAGPTIAASIRRAFPQAPVEIVPAFADERLFRPGDKTYAIAHAPWKRPLEAAAIKTFLKTYHPRHAQAPWALIQNATERQVAEAMQRFPLFLSLSKLEGLGLTPLEAMASGCVVAGFRGVGGRDFATPDNGFWAPDDDCEAAADALAEACDVVLTGGPALQERLEAGYETARQWSYARFRESLAAFWTKHASRMRVFQTS